MANYSHTKISTFRQCRFKYKLKYIDRPDVETTRSIHLFLGSMVHEALEKLYKDKINCKNDTLQDILDFYDLQWKSNYDESIIIPNPDYTAENYYDQGRQFLKEYYRSHEPFDDMKIISIEEGHKLTLPNGAKYDIKIDKLACKGSDYYVCDYKTDTRMKTQDQADEDRQLAMYSVWVLQNYPDATAVHLVWHMLRFDKDVTSERTKDQLDSLVKDIVAEIDEIESCTEWPTNRSSLCDFCEYQRYCPEYRHAVIINEETPEQLTNDEAYGTVNECAELDAQIKSLNAQVEDLKDKKKALEMKVIDYARCNNLNAVYGEKKMYTVKREDAVSVQDSNKEILKDTLIENGLFDYLQVSYPKLYTAVRKGEVEGSVADLCDIQESYKATMSKSKIKKEGDDIEK